MVVSSFRNIQPWNIFEGYFRSMPENTIAISIGTSRYICVFSGILSSGKFASCIAIVNLSDESYDLVLEVDELDTIQGMFYDPEAKMLMLNVRLGYEDQKSEYTTLKIRILSKI